MRWARRSRRHSASSLWSPTSVREASRARRRLSASCTIGRVGLDRAGQPKGVLTEHGHGLEVARQRLGARVVAARREQRVVGLGAQDGRVGRLDVRIDERLLRLGAAGSACRDFGPSSAAATAMRSTTRAASSSSAVPARACCCATAFLRHALQQLAERRRELPRLEVAEGLVEDLVPGVVGGIGGHEDRRARVVLLVVGVVEEPELLGHDDEALLGELRPCLRAEEPVDLVGRCVTSSSEVGVAGPA